MWGRPVAFLDQNRDTWIALEGMGIVRYYLLVAMSSLFLGGCTTAPYQRPNGPVGISQGSVDAFSALVPTSTTIPRCEEPADSPVGPGGRAVALVYPGPAEQQVTVILDQDGAPTRYIDVRGDLSISDERAGDRTTIGLYLEQGYAVASNRSGSEDPVIVQFPLDEALSSERLGNPGAMLQHILAVCGRAM